MILLIVKNFRKTYKLKSVIYITAQIYIKFLIFFYFLFSKLPPSRKKQLNIVHRLKKKSSRLIERYIPKQSYKHLNEQERTIEMEKIRSKYDVLMNAYNDVSKSNNEKESELRQLYQQVRVAGENTTSFSLEHDKLVEELNEKRIILQEEKTVTDKLKSQLKTLSSKVAETVRKISSFTKKSSTQKEPLHDEVKQLKANLTEKTEQLTAFKNGRLETLQEELKQRQTQAEEGKNMQAKLLQKYQRLRNKIIKHQQQQQMQASTEVAEMKVGISEKVVEGGLGEGIRVKVTGVDVVDSK